MKRFIAAALAVGCLVSSAPIFAADGGTFDKWLNPDAPECVPLAAIKSVSALTDLTPEQFQFARALYIAIPPISRQLPPGDHAIMASSDGAVMVVRLSPMVRLVRGFSHRISSKQCWLRSARE